MCRLQSAMRNSPRGADLCERPRGGSPNERTGQRGDMHTGFGLPSGAMSLLRAVLLWMAVAGLVSPVATGSVLCIESGGQIAVEAPHVSTGCAPVCADGDADDTACETPEGCSDFAFSGDVTLLKRVAFEALSGPISTLVVQSEPPARIVSGGIADRFHDPSWVCRRLICVTVLRI